MPETPCQRCRRLLAEEKNARTGDLSRFNATTGRLHIALDAAHERIEELETETGALRAELARRAGEEVVAAAVENPGELRALTRVLEGRLRAAGVVVEETCGDCGDPACDGGCYAQPVSEDSET